VKASAIRGGVGGLDLDACLARLAGEGITRLLVEGGARVARSFLEADLVDEVMLFRSAKALGGELVPALAGLPLSFIEASNRFRRTERRRFGSDVLSRYERRR
jgi:diaminohydroxyphosphoribosylaminopyrimidine deaminase/5-amino-6-(5-phosphoribosylamino)uracil reductase